MFEPQLDALKRTIKTRNGQAAPPAIEMTIAAITSDCRSRQKQGVHRPDVGDVPVNLARGFGRVHYFQPHATLRWRVATAPGTVPVRRPVSRAAAARLCGNP